MALRYLNAEELEKWKAQNPGKTYFDTAGNPVSVPSTTKDLGFLGNLARTVSKPFRVGGGALQELGYTVGDIVRMAQGKNPLERPEQYVGLTQEESRALYEDPLKEGLKSAAGVMSYAVPAGAAEGATTAGARIGTAAARGAGAGTLGSFALSESGKELETALKGAGLGALMGGALQGVGEGAKALTKTAGTGKVVNTLDVDEIAKLPSKTRSGLVKQAKSAGFWDGGLSESKNIQNYLTNRGLAGNTPAETLENLTQEFSRASKLKQEGLKEIGGLSRGYTEQIKNNLDEAIKYKGIGLDSETSKVYNDIIKTLDKGPQGARELDNIVMKWNEAGRLASGAQKTSVAGLYSDAAKAVRDTMRSIPGATKYDQGLKALNQILGVEDTGLISKAAKTAESGGIDIPLFSGAGFRGADIKTPIISNTISKAQAAIGRGQEMGGSGILGGGLSKGIQGLTGMGQRAVPAVAGLTQRGGKELATPPIGGEMERIQAPQSQGINPLNLMLAQEVLSGNISATEANAVLSLLGMDAKSTQSNLPKTDTGRKAMVARDAAIGAYQLLQESPDVAGKTAGIENLLYGLTGAANQSTAYKSQIEALRSQVFNALGGSSLTPMEKEQYEKFLPKVTDSAARARQKIEQLVPMLEALMGASISSTEILQQY